MEQQNQNIQVKPISQIIKENCNNNVETVRQKCIKKINKLLDKDDLDDDDINQLNTLMNILKCCHNDSGRWTNTKEEGEQLKGLTMGSQNFEDWHIMRLLLKIKIIESLLGGGSK